MEGMASKEVATHTYACLNKTVVHMLSLVGIEYSQESSCTPLLVALIILGSIKLMSLL